MDKGATRLEQRLEQEVMLLDGGLGSELIARGLDRGRAPESWVLEFPERVIDLHRAYVDAGSDIIHTVTFGASPNKLEAAGLEGQTIAINRAAVRLARQAAEDRTLVAGDVGPTGLLFPPMGGATKEQLEDNFIQQIEALAEAGADLISIETMFDLREALIAVQVARASGLPVFACLTFDAKKRGYFTMVGDRIGPSLDALAQAGACAVGFNCSVPPNKMLGMIEEASAEIDHPLIAQPNAGTPRPTPYGVVYDAQPESFCREVMALQQAGARVIGGCCGSTPAFIKQMRDALDKRADVPD